MGSSFSLSSSSASSVSSLDMPSIVTSTAKNYQDRFEKFSAWADEDANALPAKECRDLLLDALCRASSTATATPSSSSSSSSSLSAVLSPPFRILDAGCGSGRDLEAFAAAASTTTTTTAATIYNNNRRIEVHGFDPCPGFVAQCHAKGLSHVVQADFLTYFETKNGPDAPEEKEAESGDGAKKEQQFDAIFSLAALFHVPREQLRNVLVTFHNHLHSSTNTCSNGGGGGYLLLSLPHGNRNELGKDGRWMHYMPRRQQMQLLRDVGFEILTTRKISQYNGHDWIVTLCQKK
jgi:SAM-dependent methyltransferase